MTKVQVRTAILFGSGLIASVTVLAGCIRDFVKLYLSHANSYFLILIALSGSIALCALGLLIASFPFRRWKDKLKRLAYTDIKYDMLNENGLARTHGRLTKKWSESYVLCFGPATPKEKLAVQLGSEKVEIVNRVIAAIVKDGFFGSPLSGARSANDYFIVLIAGSSQDVNRRFQEFTAELAKRLKDNAVFTRLPIAGGAFRYRRQDPLSEQIAKADVARLQAAKNAVKSAIVFYDDKVYRRSYDEDKLRRDIDKAIIDEEFEIYYQPKFDIRLNRVAGAEALVKWNHPIRGLIPAGGFIPLAEKSNQIVDIDRYIFRCVLRDIAKWKRGGRLLVPISINLSRNDIYQDDLIPFIKTSLREFGVSAKLIEIELTESVIAKDVLYTTQVLRQIRELGIKTDMDDFGTGYSSLSMLYLFPLDVIKLDKSFFDNLEVDQKARDIAKSMIALGKTCGLEIVAEGIETARQLEFMKKTKCDYIQGNYFSESLKREDFERFIESSRFEKKETRL